MKAPKFLKKIIKEGSRIATSFSDANAGTYGAAVAYYTVFSIAPLLVIAISIAGLVVQKSSAQQAVISQFSSTFGAGGAQFIQSLVGQQIKPGANILMSIVGFVLVLIGATGIFSALESALDSIFESLPKTKAKGIWKTILQKTISLGMVLSVGFVLIISLAASAVLSSFSPWLRQFIPGGQAISLALDFGISLLLISAFLGLMLKFLPSSHKLGWKPALLGGLIAGIFFTIGKYALGLYLGSSSAATAYGAASSLVLLILWMYYMSQVFFLSAVLTRLYLVPRFSK